MQQSQLPASLLLLRLPLLQLLLSGLPAGLPPAQQRARSCSRHARQLPNLPLLLLLMVMMMVGLLAVQQGTSSSSRRAWQLWNLLLLMVMGLLAVQERASSSSRHARQLWNLLLLLLVVIQSSRAARPVQLLPRVLLRVCLALQICAAASWVNSWG